MPLRKFAQRATICSRCYISPVCHTPPQRGLMHLSPFKRRNCQSASFRSKKIADSRGSCDVAPERTAAAASGLVGPVGASFPVQGMPRDTTGVAGRRAQASFGGRKETRHAPRPVAGQAWTAWQGCDSTHQGRFTGGLGRLGLLKFLCASSSSVSPRRAGSWRASKTQGSKTGLLLGVTRF